MSDMIYDFLKMLDQGKFDLVIDQIETIKNENPEVYYYIKAKLLTYRGNYKSAKQLLSKVNEHSGNSNNPEMRIAIEAGFILIDTYFGEYQDAEERISFVYKLIDGLKDDNNRKIYWRVEILRHQGSLFAHQGYMEEAEKYTLEAIKLALEFGDPFQLSACYNAIGVIYRTHWEFEISKKYLEKSLKYAQQQNAEFSRIFPLYNLASLYIERFQFDLAVQYLDPISDYAEGLGNHLMLSQIHTNYASIYFHLGRYEESQNSLNQALQFAIEMNSVVYTSRTLLIAVKMMLHNGQIEEATQYFRKLQEFGKDHENEITIQSRIDLAEALILKAQNRILSKADAIRILQNIIERPISEYTLTIDSMIALCELYLFELSCTNNEAVLKEIEELTAKVIHIAEQKQLKALTIEFLALKAHLTRLSGEFDKSDILLETCITNAQDLGFKIMVERFIQQKKTFLEEFQHIEKLLKQNAPMYEKLEKMKVDAYIKFVNKLNITS